MTNLDLLLDSWRNVKKLLNSKNCPSEVKKDLKPGYELLTHCLLTALYFSDCKLKID